MKRKLTLLCAALLSWSGAFAQNYNYASSTGTESPFDYTATGNTVLAVPANDVLSSWQSLPFNFEFYGQPVSGYYASDNGYITFDNGASTSDPMNGSLPSAGGPNDAIYAFWTDLDIASGSGSADEIRSYTYGASPNRVHVIQWFSVTPAGGSGFLYTAIRLYECGDFDIVHNFGNATISGTVGCENASGSAGVDVGAGPIAYPGIGSGADDDIVYTFYWDQISYDVAVTATDPSDFVMVGSNTVTGTVENYGGTAITSFDVNYSVDGGATQTMSVTANIPAGGGTYNFTHSTPWDVVTGGEYLDLCVWVDNLNGGNADERTCNDQLCKTLFSGTGISGDRTVLIEEFTGAWCGYCPDGAVVLENILTTYPNDAIGVSVHDGDAMEFNDSIRTAFGVTGYPNAMVDRKVFPGEADEPHSRSAWLNNTTAQIGSYTPANVSMLHSYDPTTREITIEVKGTFTDYATGDMRFATMIVEDGIVGSSTGYDQTNYMNGTSGHPYFGAGDPIVGYVHDHVLRALPSGAFGNAGTIPSTTAPNDHYTETFTYTLPATMDETKIKLVGFMAYHSTGIGEREVIDAAQQELAYQGNVGVEMVQLAKNIEVYPNPTNGDLNLAFDFGAAHETEIIVFDAYGKQVAMVEQGLLPAGSQHVTFDTNELDNGIYFVSIKVDGNATFTKQFVVTK